MPGVGTLHGGRHLRRGLKAVGRLLLERPPDNPVHGLDRGGAGQRRRTLIEHRVHRRHVRRCSKRGPTGHHFEEQHPGCEQVGTDIHLRAVKLLGRHVGGRADDLARHGQVGCGSHDVINYGLRQAEVEQLDAIAGHEHVRRLQIAVDDATGV